MRLLQSGIPLSLLYDLVLGPESAELLELEGADQWQGAFDPALAQDSRLVRLAQLLADGTDRESDPV